MAAWSEAHSLSLPQFSSVRHSFPLGSPLTIPRISRRWKSTTAYRAVLPLIVVSAGTRAADSGRSKSTTGGPGEWGLCCGAHRDLTLKAGVALDTTRNRRQTAARWAALVRALPVANTEKQPVGWAEWPVVGGSSGSKDQDPVK